MIDLGQNLRAVISQRLVKGIDGKLVPAAEIMLRTSYIAELIERRQIDKLKEAMAQGREEGMQTFDQSLYDLVRNGKISQETALQHADSRTNLALKLRLENAGGGSKPDEELQLKEDNAGTFLGKRPDQI